MTLDSGLFFGPPCISQIHCLRTVGLNDVTHHVTHKTFNIIW